MNFLIVLVYLLSIALAKFSVGPDKLACDPSLPNLSVGDLNLTNKNFM